MRAGENNNYELCRMQMLLRRGGITQKELIRMNPRQSTSYAGEN